MGQIFAFQLCLNSDFLILLCRYLTSGFTASKCILIYFVMCMKRKTMGLKILRHSDSYWYFYRHNSYQSRVLPPQKEGYSFPRGYMLMSSVCKASERSYSDSDRFLSENEKIDWSQFENSTNILRVSHPLIHKTLSARMSPRRACSIAGRARIPTELYSSAFASGYCPD